MYVITKSIAFSAGHRLDHLQVTHPCNQYHGHNYSVDVSVQCSTLSAVEEWVVDFGTLKRAIDGAYDHKNLNDVMDCHPTAENLSRVIWELLQMVCVEQRPGSDILVNAVTVYETPTSSATYMPEQ